MESRRPATGSRRAVTRLRSAREGPGCCTETGRTSCRTRTDRSKAPTRCRRDSTIRGSGRIEGIIPALESSHALAHAEKLARGRPSSDVVIVNLSGRGDKDIPTVAALQGIGELPG